MNDIMAVLSPILGDELAAEIILHRKAKKPPFTAYAAKLQVKEYIKTGDPIAAAEMQILRGWTAIKASWYFNELAREKKTADALKNPWDAFGAPPPRQHAPEPVNEDMRKRLRIVGIGG